MTLPILWNKLGSIAQVTTSEIGSGGNIVGSIGFEPSKYDDGFIAKAPLNGITFPIEIQDQIRDRGTIELWFTPKYSNPIPYVAGYFMLFAGDIQFWWGDGVSGGGGLVVQLYFGNPSWPTAEEPTPWIATPYQNYHLAAVWDKSGIDGSSDTIRIYRDGVIVANAATAAWGTDPAIYNSPIGIGADAQYDRYIIDNMKIYDYAKTDFSDRFVEGFIPARKGHLTKLTSSSIVRGPLPLHDTIAGQNNISLVRASNRIGGIIYLD